MTRAADPGSRIILALDVSSAEEALAWAERFRNRVGMVKVGLRLFTAAGPSLVARLVAGGHAVFLDLKFHDIPNTVASAVVEAARLGASMLTVHASGGIAMLRAASEAASRAARETLPPLDATGPRDVGALPGSAARAPSTRSGSGANEGRAGTGPACEGAGASATGDSSQALPRTQRAGAAVSPRPGRTRVLAVTLLTSLDTADLAAAGVVRAPDDQVLALAETAWIAGCDGLVASPREVSALRARLGPEALLVTPGIRMPEESAADQRRVATPREALTAGADYLVIGRTILDAADPLAALARILDSLERDPAEPAV